MSLVRLVYISASLLADDPNERRQIADILLTSRRNNEESKVTGALLATDHNFSQVLEGERDAVEATYERIARDPRHKDIVLILYESIEVRRFPDWTMAWIGPSQSAEEAVARVTSKLPVMQDRPSGPRAGHPHEPDVGAAEPGRRPRTGGRVIRSGPASMAHFSSAAAGKPSLAIKSHSAAMATASLSASTAAEHHIGAETLVLEERIAADLDLGMRCLELGKARSGVAFRHIEADRAGQHRAPLGEARADRVEHHLHDARHAGQYDHVVEHVSPGPARWRCRSTGRPWARAPCAAGPA